MQQLPIFSPPVSLEELSRIATQRRVSEILRQNAQFAMLPLSEPRRNFMNSSPFLREMITRNQKLMVDFINRLILSYVINYELSIWRVFYYMRSFKV